MDEQELPHATEEFKNAVTLPPLAIVPPQGKSQKQKSKSTLGAWSLKAVHSSAVLVGTNIAAVLLF